LRKLRRRAPHSGHINICFRQPLLAVLAVEKVLLERSRFLCTEIGHRVFFEFAFVRMSIEVLRHCRL